MVLLYKWWCPGVSIVSRPLCGVGSTVCVATTGCNPSSPSLTATQNLRVTISPPVIASGSSEQFMITCQAEMGQVLYHPSYQFFLNESPIGAPTNSSYIMVDATSSGNFTCNATQYSDQGTSVPSPQSAAVQAIVLGESVFMQYNIKYKHHKNNMKSYLSVLDSITCVVSCKPAVYFYMNNIICAIYVQLCA